MAINAVPARHGVRVEDAYTFGEELSGGLMRYVGYVFAAPGVAVYHAGDTILYDGMLDRLRPFRIEVALLPINGRDADREARGLVGNLDAREAVELARGMGAAVLVPMHYDMFGHNTGRPEEVVALARANGHSLRVEVLERGRPAVFSGSGRS